MESVRSNFYNKTATLLTAILLSTIFLKLFSVPVVCVLMGIIILLCILMNKHCLNNTISLGIILFLFIALLYQLVGNGESINNYLIKSLYFILGLSLANSLKKFTKEQQRFLLFILLSLFSFSILMTYLILSINPMAVRNYGYVVEETDLYLEASSLFGMYSYGIGETFAFMMPSLLCFSLNTKNITLKYIMLAMVILGIITQYMATLTTSFFLSLGCSILVLFFFYKKAKIKKIVAFALLVFPFIIYFASKSQNFENVQFLTKMEDIQQSIGSGQSSGQVQTRSNLYMQSIEVFLSNPLLGLGNVQSQANTHDTRVVSMHTTIFDYLGLYGLFALLLFTSWKKFLYKSLSIVPPHIRRIYKIPLLALFGLLLLKGPVSIGTNFLFSTFILTLLYYSEYYRIQDK